MVSRLAKVPIAVYVPAVRPVQGMAAYCITSQVLVGYTSVGGKNLWRLASGSSSGSSRGTKMTYIPPNPLEASSVGSWVDVPTAILDGSVAGTRLGGSSSSSSSSSQLVPRYETVQTCYPAIPSVAGSPARTDYLANEGWNAGARTREPVPTFGSFRGTMPSTLSATQFGLANRHFDHTYEYMTHSIVARPGEWSVVERGVTKAAGALPAEATLEIQRLGGKVVYLANDVELYVSDSPSLGEVYGAAVLHSLTDGVDDASIHSLGQRLRFAGELPAWRFAGAGTGSLSILDAELPIWQLAGQLSRTYGVMRFQADLPSVRLLGADKQLMLLDEALPAAQLSASLGRKEYVRDQFFGVLPATIISATLISGGAMRVDTSLPPILGVGAERPIAFLKGTAPVATLIAGEPYMPPGEIDGSDGAVVYDRAVLESALLLVAVDSLEAQSTAAELVVIVELATTDAVELRDSTTLGQVVEMLAMERVAVNSATSVARRQALQYAVNLATGALTTYDGFDFSGFARDEQNAYGWKPDGLYRIGAPLDDGAVLQALVDFGTDDFSDSRVKRLGYAYLGVRTDGQCFLRVQADVGAERVYRVRGGNNVRRSKLADGISGRYWSLRLEIVDASFAEIDSLELPIGVTQRRTFGSRN